MNGDQNQMSPFDLLLQQIINGLSLGSMYALLALGFTIVYGILELINFSHFNVFMIGSFVAMGVLSLFGLNGQSVLMIVTMCACGFLGVLIERLALRPLRGVQGPMAMITTIGVSYVLSNTVMLAIGANTKNFPNPIPPLTFHFGTAQVTVFQIIIWVMSALLMGGLYLFVQRSKLGKAMRATAQDPDAALMMGVEVNRVIMTAFFLGSALAGAAGFIFGLYYNFTNFGIGFTAGLRAFTAAVLGGIGNIPGAMLGGIIIGLIEAMAGQYVGAKWADVIIFSILVLVLIARPAGLLGRLAPTKS
jgi:branched-chain amino acid transport system permease protein